MKSGKTVNAGWDRTQQGATNDTQALVIHLVTLCTEQAKSLGFENDTAWKITEQVKLAQYSVDEGQIKLYFELTNVLSRGVLWAASQLSQRFREVLLFRANSQDLELLYRHWCGHDPLREPML